MNSEYVMVKVDDLAEIKTRLSSLEEAVKHSAPTTPDPPELVTRDDMAADLEVSRYYFNSHPWALPNFGDPDIPGRPDKWYRRTWEAWRDDLPGRREEWEEKCREERGA